MNHPSTLLLSQAPWPGIQGALRRIVAGAHWLKIAYAEQRRAARERAEFDSLDDNSLRDLGITRDEYLSYAAEARGLVPSTRLRIRDDRFRSPPA
jgi:uncharacterized protein YjiS (DUF1127 family)